MKNRDAFADCHPAAVFSFFVLVLAVTMFSMEPSCLLVSLGSALAYGAYREGGKGFSRRLRYALPMALLAAGGNALFNHRGETVLVRLPAVGAVTLESVCFGLAAAVLLGAVLSWFSCYHQVMTTDKFIYLFGRAIPSLSLVLSMALRFVPRFRAQFRAMEEARKGMGRAGAPEGPLQRLRDASIVLAAMVAWAAENAVDTADSMKGRGYGLPGRTAFSLYRWSGRDRALLAWALTCGLLLLACRAAGGTAWQYYPRVQAAPITAALVLFRLFFLALCLTPLLLDLWAGRAGAGRRAAGERR